MGSQMLQQRLLGLDVESGCDRKTRYGRKRREGGGNKSHKSADRVSTPESGVRGVKTLPTPSSC